MYKRPKPLDGCNKCYQIYALSDPRTNLVSYVGMSGDAQTHYYQHLLNLGGGWQERRWIIELKQLSLIPIFQILETVGNEYNALSMAQQREHYWINELLLRGNPLLNIDTLIRGIFYINKKPSNTSRGVARFFVYRF